jgi:hypothetical protein
MSTDPERRRRREEAEAAERAKWAAHPGARFLLGAPLTCLSCGHEFQGEWWGNEPADETADQRCPECGHVFEVTWPGWQIEPDVIIIEPSGDGRNQRTSERISKEELEAGPRRYRERMETDPEFAAVVAREDRRRREWAEYEALAEQARINRATRAEATAERDRQED